MNSAIKPNRMTPAEYLARERMAPTRSQFVDGTVTAMAGSSFAHNTIALNVADSLRRQLRGKPCRVHVSDVRVCVDQNGLYTYPDVLISCEPRELLEGAPDTLLNPSVIFEVLSPSTELFDRGAKFLRYQTIPSLTHYVLIAQHRQFVECFTREGETWSLRNISGPQGVLELSAVNCAVSLAGIYEDVSFAEAERSPELYLFGGDNLEQP